MATTSIREKITSIKEQIVKKGSREARSAGNPHASDIDRELSNEGFKRKPEDIPKQDVKNIRGQVVPGNVNGGFQSSTVETNGVYTMGPAKRPPITHDAGFSILPKKDPELSDYWELLKWMAMLEGANSLRPDLCDGAAAYSHFLNGNGTPRTFSYERYVNNDNNGRVTLRNATLDAQDAAIKLWRNGGQPQQFSFTGPAIPCGSFETYHSHLRTAFPYPATENWQKTIGAHTIWLSGQIHVRKRSVVGSKPAFFMKLELHAEDQYNFNPGMKDMVTGIPDDANGKFVVVGFAKGYRHTATLTRTFSWEGFDLGIARMGPSLQMRQGRPQR